MTSKPSDQAKQFWDDIFAQGQQGEFSRVEMPDMDDPVLNRALDHFGDIRNKTLIDLGCGRGATSLFFAQRGANVISVDMSELAIRNLTEYCHENGITNITPRQLSAQELSELSDIDCIFGAMILHHIEPFSEFAEVLKTTMKQGAKGFFWENNAQSKLLIWFRQNVVGKLWVPKFGDPDEFPLTPDEVNELRKYFDVAVEYPVLHFFIMFSSYILKGKLKTSFAAIDDYCYRFEWLRKYSYRQYVLLS